MAESSTWRARVGWVGVVLGGTWIAEEQQVARVGVCRGQGQDMVGAGSWVVVFVGARRVCLHVPVVPIL
jgi:hypothetical protein